MNDPTTSTDTNVSESFDLDGNECYAGVGTYDAWYGDDVAVIDSDPLDLSDEDIPY